MKFVVILYTTQITVTDPNTGNEGLFQSKPKTYGVSLGTR